MKTIDLFQALKEMRESKAPFSVSFVTYSTTRQTGGELITLNNVLVGRQSSNANINSMIAFKSAENKDESIRRCYIWSIVSYNNQKIIW